MMSKTFEYSETAEYSAEYSEEYSETEAKLN